MPPDETLHPMGLMILHVAPPPDCKVKVPTLTLVAPSSKLVLVMLMESAAKSAHKHDQAKAARMNRVRISAPTLAQA